MNAKSVIALVFQGILMLAACIFKYHCLTFNSYEGSSYCLIASSILMFLCVGYTTILIIIAKYDCVDSSFGIILVIIVSINTLLVVFIAIIIHNPIIVGLVLVLILSSTFVLLLG